MVVFQIADSIFTFWNSDCEGRYGFLILVEGVLFVEGIGYFQNKITQVLNGWIFAVVAKVWLAVKIEDNEWYVSDGGIALLRHADNLPVLGSGDINHGEVTTTERIWHLIKDGY